MEAAGTGSRVPGILLVGHPLPDAAETFTVAGAIVPGIGMVMVSPCQPHVCQEKILEIQQGDIILEVIEGFFVIEIEWHPVCPLRTVSIIQIQRNDNIFRFFIRHDLK